MKTHNLSLTILCLLIFSQSSQAQLMLEPMEGATGARVQSMGRAYAAAPAEPDSLFLNPASLSEINRRGITSMYSKFQNQADFYLIGIVNPVKIGVVGVGLIKTQVNGIYRDPSTGKIYLQSGSKQKMYNDILLVGYGREIMPNLSAGISLKSFNKGLISRAGAGTGFDADFGLLYRYNQHLSLGFLQRNVFAALGSTIQWTDDRYEVIANATRFGVNYHLYNFNIGADYEFYPASVKRGLFMIGSEWWPIPEFALRMGLDETQSSNNDFNIGLSYITSIGIKLDYTYHQYFLKSQDTHFFSISFPIDRKSPPEPAPILIEKAVKETKELITLKSAYDKTLNYGEAIVIEGAVSPEIKELLFRGKTVTLQNNAFQLPVTLFPGKNLISLSGLGSRGKTVAEKRIRILNLLPFKDVPSDYWAKYPIAFSAMLNLVPGYRDGTFRPEANLTRRDMYNILLNLSDLGDPFPQILPNEPLSQPEELVTRADAVSTITRFARIPVIAISNPPYPDVPGRHFAAEEISAAKYFGLLNYLQGKNFDPGRKITRAEICQLIVKLKPVALRVSGLLDFDSGYPENYDQAP